MHIDNTEILLLKRSQDSNWNGSQHFKYKNTCTSIDFCTHLYLYTYVYAYTHWTDDRKERQLIMLTSEEYQQSDENSKIWEKI